MKVLKAYKFRLYPTKSQRQFFIETFGCVRFTYNALLKDRQHQELREVPGQSMTPAKLKKSHLFLKKTDSLALANAQRNLERAFQNYYAGRCSHPKLKTKKASWQSYTTNNQQGTIRIDHQQLKLPKIKSLIPLKMHRQIQGHIKSATISSKNLEEFYVSILCEEQVAPLPKTKKKITLQFCPNQLIAPCEISATLSYEQTSLEKRLEKAQKRLSTRATSARNRQVKLQGAKNYQKQKQRLLHLIQLKQARQKAYLDELSILLVRQYDEIILAIPKNEEKSCFTPADWQKFLQKLKYKAHWYGKSISLQTIFQS